MNSLLQAQCPLAVKNFEINKGALALPALQVGIGFVDDMNQKNEDAAKRLANKTGYSSTSSLSMTANQPDTESTIVRKPICLH